MYGSVNDFTSAVGGSLTSTSPGVYKGTVGDYYFILDINGVKSGESRPLYIYQNQGGIAARTYFAVVGCEGGIEIVANLQTMVNVSKSVGLISSLAYELDPIKGGTYIESSSITRTIMTTSDAANKWALDSALSSMNASISSSIASVKDAMTSASQFTAPSLAPFYNYMDSIIFGTIYTGFGNKTINDAIQAQEPFVVYNSISGGFFASNASSIDRNSARPDLGYGDKYYVLSGTNVGTFRLP